MINIRTQKGRKQEDIGGGTRARHIYWAPVPKEFTAWELRPHMCWSRRGKEVKAKRKGIQTYCGPNKGGAKQAHTGSLGASRGMKYWQALPRPGDHEPSTGWKAVLSQPGWHHLGVHCG